MGESKFLIIKKKGKKNEKISKPSAMLKTKFDLLSLCWWPGHGQTNIYSVIFSLFGWEKINRIM